MDHDRQPRTLEMLGDPNINLTVFVRNSNMAGILYAYEVCDACEDDSLCYQIDNILLSDFVYPSGFESFRAEGSAQSDRMNKIQDRRQLLAGGYIGAFDVTSGSGWQQTTAEKHPTSLRNHRNDAIPLTTCGSSACTSARS